MLTDMHCKDERVDEALGILEYMIHRVQVPLLLKMLSWNDIIGVTKRRGIIVSSGYE